MADTILIADDEASIRDLARLYLEKEGLDVYKRQGLLSGVDRSLLLPQPHLSSRR